MWRECVLCGARVYTTAQVTGCDPSLGQEGIIGRQGCGSGILDAGLGSLESVAAGATSWVHGAWCPQAACLCNTVPSRPLWVSGRTCVSSRSFPTRWLGPPSSQAWASDVLQGSALGVGCTAALHATPTPRRFQGGRCTGLVGDEAGAVCKPWAEQSRSARADSTEGSRCVCPAHLSPFL